MRSTRIQNSLNYLPALIQFLTHEKLWSRDRKYVIVVRMSSDANDGRRKQEQIPARRVRRTRLRTFILPTFSPEYVRRPARRQKASLSSERAAFVIILRIGIAFIAASLYTAARCNQPCYHSLSDPLICLRTSPHITYSSLLRDHYYYYNYYTC